MPGLHCCTGFSLVAVSGGYSLDTVCGLLIVVASLAVEQGLQVLRLQWLRLTGSVVVTHGLGCSKACGIFLDQGWNPSLLHWQADS